MMNTPTDAEAARALRDRLGCCGDEQCRSDAGCDCLSLLTNRLSAAHAAGRREGLEEAARIAEMCEQHRDWRVPLPCINGIAAAIRART